MVKRLLVADDRGGREMGEELMKLDTEHVAKGLFDEIMEVLKKYNGSLLTPTVIGVIEMVKADLIYATAVPPDEDEEDDEDEA